MPRRRPTRGRSGVAVSVLTDDDEAEHSIEAPQFRRRVRPAPVLLHVVTVGRGCLPKPLSDRVVVLYSVPRRPFSLFHPYAGEVERRAARQLLVRHHVHDERAPAVDQRTARRGARDGVDREVGVDALLDRHHPHREGWSDAVLRSDNLGFVGVACDVSHGASGEDELRSLVRLQRPRQAHVDARAGVHCSPRRLTGGSDETGDGSGLGPRCVWMHHPHHAGGRCSASLSRERRYRGPAHRSRA